MSSADANIYTFGSLFSGIGGLDLGLELAGWRCLWQVEKEPYARQVLAKWWPNITQHVDVTCTDYAVLEPPLLLAGGFPCQDVSLAGAAHGPSKGLAGARSGLWYAFRDAIACIRPGMVLIENVKALLNNGADDVLRQVSAIGYDAFWDCIPASAVGAYQERDRLFIVAWLRPVGDSAALDGNPTSLRLAQRPSLGRYLGQELQAAMRTNRCDGPYAGQWALEPPVGRLVHGLSSRLDGSLSRITTKERIARIKGLGNAVVPQVAEAIGRALIRTLERG